MKIYGFLLLAISLSLQAADNTNHLASVQANSLRKECALVAIDAFLLDLRKTGIKAESPEQGIYENLISERGKLERNNLNDIKDPAIKAMFSSDDYKEKIALLHRKYTSPTPQRRISSHLPLDSNPAAVILAMEIKKNKETVIQLYKKLFPE